MGMGVLEQLIAKGRPSPITSALKGFQQGAGIMPGIKMAQLAPQLRQAQIQLAQAQAQKALQQAKNPFASQPLSGAAHDAESDILFKKRYADNPEDLGELKKAQDRVERSANARWWSTVPSDERAQVLGNLKSLGIDPVKATQLLMQGHSEQEIIDMHQAAQNPTPTGTTTTPTASNVHNETPATIDKSLQEAKDATKPLKWQDITPNYAPTGAAKTRTQEAASASAGLDYLGKYIANNLNYGGITAKITRPWLQDIHSNDPAKQQKAVDYYVAQAVKPELALLRIRIQGGQASARAMSALMPSILGHIEVDMANAPAKMQQRVQLKATQVLNEAAYQSELQTRKPDPNVYNPNFDHGKNISSEPTAAPQQATTGLIKASDGRSYSREELQKIAAGGK